MYVQDRQGAIARLPALAYNTALNDTRSLFCGSVFALRAKTEPP
jgi:hypothetical protein